MNALRIWILSAAAVGFVGVAWAWMPSLQKQGQSILIRLDQDVCPGVRVTGFVGLSEPVSTINSPGRRVRILAYDATVSNNGAAVVRFQGIPMLDVEKGEPSRDVIRTRPGAKPVSGDENLPRRCALIIRPKGERTWGTVQAEADFEVVVEWEPQ